MPKRDPENLPSLVIEYRVAKGKEGAALKMRHAVEDWVGALLEEKDLGSCDGGSIGSGTMEVFCDVFDYAKAKRTVERAIKSTPYAGFKRIYKIAAEKPQKPAGKAAMYAKGDCLAVKLRGGLYTAAYIAACDAKMGSSHVVIELDYLEKAKPELKQFRKMKPLVLTHHEWESELQASVTPRRTQALDATIEVVGNLALKLRGVDIGVAHGSSWVNWKAKPNRVTAAMLKEDPGMDPAAGKYIGSTGDWDLGFQILMQRKWDSRKKR